MNSFTQPPPGALIDLCDAHGRLNPQAIGWSAQPLTDCSIPGHFGRRKRWNHWCITTPDWVLSLTQADLDYLGYAAAYFLDLHSGQSIAHSQLRPLSLGCRLPDQAHQSHAFNHPKLQLRVSEHTGRTRITVSAPDIGGQPLHIALDIQRPSDRDSVNLVAPMGRRGFHATCRELGLPCSGSVQLGDRQYLCSPGQSFASMDFGRGVWPLNSHWTRAAFAAPGGIAGNFGAGWTDQSELSENALWFGGDLQQLDSPVTIAKTAHSSPTNWQLHSQNDEVSLSFSPLQLHQVYHRLGPFYADTQQWFGHFNGELRTPQGERVPVRNALGWLGETRARW